MSSLSMRRGWRGTARPGTTGLPRMTSSTRTEGRRRPPARLRGSRFERMRLMATRGWWPMSPPRSRRSGSAGAAARVLGPANIGGASAANVTPTVAAATVAVVLVAACLIFFRLDQRLLWVDEAETALLARSVLIYGVPRAYDGRNLVSQEVGREYRADYVWRWTPWLEKYLTAGSFAVLGESTFTARLPFALVGLLSVVSMYTLAVTLFRDRWVGVLTMAFLALSVPFLLHVRQCRYYSLAILAPIWTVSVCGARGLPCIGVVPQAAPSAVGRPDVAPVPRPARDARRLRGDDFDRTVVLLPLHREPASVVRRPSRLHVPRGPALERHRRHAVHRLPPADRDLPPDIRLARELSQVQRPVGRTVVPCLRHDLPARKLPLRGDAFVRGPDGAPGGVPLAECQSGRSHLHQLRRSGAEILRPAGGPRRAIRTAACGLAGTGVGHRPEFLPLRRSAPAAGGRREDARLAEPAPGRLPAGAGTLDRRPLGRHPRAAAPLVPRPGGREADAGLSPGDPDSARPLPLRAASARPGDRAMIGCAGVGSSDASDVRADEPSRRTRRGQLRWNQL